MSLLKKLFCCSLLLSSLTLVGCGKEKTEVITSEWIVSEGEPKENTSAAEGDFYYDKTTNHFKCIDYVIDNANKKLSENFIKELHFILKTGTSDSRKSWFNVGEYKKLKNYVGNIETSIPSNVDKDMKELLNWYKSLNNIKTL